MRYDISSRDGSNTVFISAVRLEEEFSYKTTSYMVKLEDEPEVTGFYTERSYDNFLINERTRTLTKGPLFEKLVQMAKNFKGVN